MARKLVVIVAFFAAVLPLLGVAQTTVPARPGEELHRTPAKKGWFWYIDPAQKKEAPPAPVQSAPVVAPVVVEKPAQPIVVVSKPAPATETPLSREELCGKKDTWEKTCGFIDPGDDFEFQAKQRDVLLQVMSLTPDNPDAVEAAQRYMKWVVRKASMAANMWYFNMVQSPDLNPTVKNPISEVGLALASRVTQASQFEYFKVIREEGGVLFYFTRSDCAFCYDQAPYTLRVAHTMGLPIINVPLDGRCITDFTGERCADNIAHDQMQFLDLKIVPALYLYVPHATWIRLGTGVMSDQTIIANTVNFFSAYRAALLTGLDNSKGARPTVSFDPEVRKMPGGTGDAAPTATPQIDRDRMMELLGYKKPSQ